MIMHENNEVMWLADELKRELLDNIQNSGQLFNIETIVDIFAIKIAELQYENKNIFFALKNLGDIINF